MRKRRFEIHLPLRYNDGRPVSDELFEVARELLVQRFGGLTFWPRSLWGTWIYEGARYDEEMALVVVDGSDTKSILQCFIKLKSALRSDFEQIEIYIASYPIDIL